LANEFKLPVPCPTQVTKLIEKFELHGEAYHSAGYKEAQLRQEFIDPLFESLGWDMDNTAGKAEAYKDVIHEDAIKLGGGHKAPDYCFHVENAIATLITLHANDDQRRNPG
jgi:predicted type IV restriction endonuclease